MCGNPNCVAEKHIRVESKKENEARIDCHRNMVISKVTIDGKVYMIRSNYKCPHNPQCLFRYLDMSAMEEPDGTTTTEGEFEEGFENITSSDWLALGG